MRTVLLFFLLPSTLTMGQIIEVPVNETLVLNDNILNETIGFDVNQDDQIDFVIKDAWNEFPVIQVNFESSAAWVAGETQTAHYCLPGGSCSSTDVEAVAEISRISIDDSWDWGNKSYQSTATIDHTIIWDGTNFKPSTDHQYIGFKFLKNGNTHYGIIKLLYPSKDEITVVSWFYGATPNESISSDIITGNKPDPSEENQLNEVIIVTSDTQINSLKEHDYHWFTSTGQVVSSAQSQSGLYILINEKGHRVRAIIP